MRRALAAQKWDSLDTTLRTAGLEPGALLPRLKRYCELLLQWNRKVSNLISRNDEPRLVSRHVAESLVPAGALRQIATGDWMDFGSGGGLPAIPLILAGVGERWVLVESRRTKCLFMRRAVQELGLTNVQVEQARLEDVVGNPDLLGRFQGFTSRATLALPATLEMASLFVRNGGTACLWKGSKLESEMAGGGAWSDHWQFIGSTSVGEEQAVAATFQRI